MAESFEWRLGMRRPVTPPQVLRGAWATIGDALTPLAFGGLLALGFAAGLLLICGWLP
jgi:hypothetical protein